MRKIAQISPETKTIVKVYKSIKQAEKETGITTIKKCLTLEQKTAGGYTWWYHSAGLEKSPKLIEMMLS